MPAFLTKEKVAKMCRMQVNVSGLRGSAVRIVLYATQVSAPSDGSIPFR